MLHLSLTGKLLSALNGSMDLYDYRVIPQYPGHILVQKIPMNLDSANKENLECFLQVRVDPCLASPFYVDLSHDNRSRRLTPLVQPPIMTRRGSPI